MVRIQSPSGDKTIGRQPKPYRHSPDPVRHREQADPIQHREFKPTNLQFEYKPYKPSHVGIYGEKPREKKPTPKQTQRVHKPKETFECYSYPKGPDIRTGKIGPDYPTRAYEFKEYKPGTPFLDTKQKSDKVDPLKVRSSYIDRPVEVYKGDVTYKLNENNNAAMRHWKYGFVNDTVSAKRSTIAETYAVPEKTEPKRETKKPVESKPKTPEDTKPRKKAEPKPVVAAILPVQKTAKKTFTSSSTQHEGPGVKTTTTQTQDKKTTSSTQYEAQKQKTMSIQTDTPVMPTPAIAPVPIPNKTVQTRSESVQCSEPPKNVTVRGTQSDNPSVRAQDTQTTVPVRVQDTQTSPIVFSAPQAQRPVQERRLSPEYVRQETPVYRSARQRTPPPIAPLVIATEQKRENTPKRQSLEPARQSPVQKPPSPKKTTPVTEKPRSPPKQTKQQSPPTANPADSRWTPSPEVTQMSAVYAKPPSRYEITSPEPTHKHEAFRSVQKSPSVSIPKQSEPLPEAFSTPSVAKQPTATSSGRSILLYQTPRRRLPPEVTACIEAYDCAHGPA